MTKTAQEAIKLLVASQELEKIATAMLEADGIDKEALKRELIELGGKGLGALREAVTGVTPAYSKLMRAPASVMTKAEQVAAKAPVTGTFGRTRVRGAASRWAGSPVAAGPRTSGITL